MTTPRNDGRRGFAMVVVLLTLLALLVLCTPFLMTVRNADHASAQIADRRSAELALDAAGRLCRGRLGASHPALDVTPYHDSLEELLVDNGFDPEFFDANDATGVMFDLDAYDVSGRVDLNSAPPQMIGNLIGGTAVTLGTVEADGDTIRATSARGFQPDGFLWLDGELIGYSQLEGSTFGGLVRELGVETDAEGNPLPCGPQPAHSVRTNTTILDQRAMAIAQWRVFTPDGTLRRLDSIEQIRETHDLVMVESLGLESLETLEKTCTVYSELQAGSAWQHPTRIVNPVNGGLTCRIRLLNARWVNAGTTVMITDGTTTELGIVQKAQRGTITLMDPLVNDYDEYTALLYPLARRPVNVNTAGPEVLRALVLHLQLFGRQARITSSEADILVSVIRDSRPFTSFEDFVRRVVLPCGGFAALPLDAPVPEAFQIAFGQLPAGGGGGDEENTGHPVVQLIDDDDARALYKNALNANDAELGFSTMPFCFVSSDVHAMELRAAVNARSGVERVAAVREQVELITPQRDLMYLATRQEDFDRALRLHRDARGWATGPEVTSRYDPFFRSSPPTRSRPHLGLADTMRSTDPLSDEPTHTFAARDEEEQEGFAMPWAHRVEESGNRAGRMFHFDSETRDPEGRYLPDGTIRRGTDDGVVGWGDGLLRPLSFSAWIKPRALEPGAMFLDCGGPYSDTDRITLMLEDEDLVLRVLDAAGDHPSTSFEEVATVRYPLASGDGPGMPLDTWLHVEVDVRGNRPDQMLMLVDGKWRSEIPGLTRLTGSLGPDATTIPVESTEGFPANCVLRIGDELIEATVAGETSFTAVFEEEGSNAGFGGRLSRRQFSGVEFSAEEGAQGVAQPGTGSFASGTPVMLYGYALPIASNIPPANGSLPGDLGIFAVGMVVGMNGEDEEIVVELNDGSALNLGLGLDTQQSGVLEIEPADPNMTTEEVMAAFNPNGGYAALATVNFQPRVTSASTGVVTEPTQTINGTRLGGLEIIHYTGWSGNQLIFDRRGNQVVNELPNLQQAPPEIGPSGAFVLGQQWSVFFIDGSTPNDRMVWQTKIFPISLGVQGAGAFDQAEAGNSQVAQITRLGPDSHLTEWVRYDYRTQDQLVRDDPVALGNARFAVQAGIIEEGIDITAPGPGGPGSGGPTGPSPPPAILLPEPPGPAAPPAAPPAVDGAYWHYRMGNPEDTDYLITRAVRSQFQFRGVFGTYPHVHTGGTAVLPVWRTFDSGVDDGRPGRFDAVMMIDADTSDPGFPGVVHHAHRPNEYTVYSWSPTAEPLGVGAGGAPVSLEQFNIATALIHVALEDVAPVPVAAGTNQPGDEIYDSRVIARIAKYPSGEMPREANQVAVGGSYQAGGAIPSALVDEICFGSSEFTGDADTWGAQMRLEQDLGEEGDTIDLVADAIRLPLGLFFFSNAAFLSGMPPDAGLLRIGDEILCYEGYEANTGTVSIAPNGRGLLGTDPQPHSIGEVVTLLESIPVAVLAGQLGAEDGAIELGSTDDFPREGLVLIDDELVHYSWIQGGALAMPRASSEPGAMDGDGPGIFRGRFGTGASSHESGTPVILHPFRYWDCWSDRADAPELHYFGFSVDQPAALWKTVFWDVEEADASGPRLGVLQRTDPDVPWDEEPDATAGLSVMWEGIREGEPNSIGVQADRIEWRVFTRYEPGSYDADTGAQHGWKATPRLRFFGAEYIGPGLVLKRVER